MSERRSWLPGPRSLGRFVGAFVRGFREAVEHARDVPPAPTPEPPPQVPVVELERVVRPPIVVEEEPPAAPSEPPSETVPPPPAPAGDAPEAPAPGRKWKKGEKRALVVDLAKQGMSRSEIHLAVGGTMHALDTMLSNARMRGSLPPSPQSIGGRPPHPKRDEILAMYRNGRTPKEIADALGLSCSSVRSFLKRERQRVTPPRLVRPPEPRPAQPAPVAPETWTEKVAGLFNQGMGRLEIQKHLGCSMGAVDSAIGFGRRRGLIPPKA